MYMRRLVKMGNAIGISLPKRYIAHMGLKEGDFLEIIKQMECKEAPIMLFPVFSEKKYVWTGEKVCAIGGKDMSRRKKR